MAADLIIVGASARAAAMSALRANLRPWCADLFGDVDLRLRCPTAVVPVGNYPQGLVEAIAHAPQGPWMYTGGLENRPALVADLARTRPLWGNGPEVLACVRSPQVICKILESAGCPCPRIWHSPVASPAEGCWLLKPRRGAGGAGIRRWRLEKSCDPIPDGCFLQEYIEGESFAALFVGDGTRATLRGVTRQLVGESWLHAAPFHYCGSIGPIDPHSKLQDGLQRVGTAIAAGTGARGLFGVDFILRDGQPWPVEINPRYTSSVEVLEHAFGIPAVALHRQVFDSAATITFSAPVQKSPIIGKAILFAERPIVFPLDGPWMQELRFARSPWEMPGFADIPPETQTVPARRPILTFFARDHSPDACLTQLRLIAKDLDRCLEQS